MAQETWAVKIDEDVKKDIREILDSREGTAGEFI